MIANLHNAPDDYKTRPELVRDCERMAQMLWDGVMLAKFSLGILEELNQNRLVRWFFGAKLRVAMDSLGRFVTRFELKDSTITKEK